MNDIYLTVASDLSVGGCFLAVSDALKRGGAQCELHNELPEEAPCTPCRSCLTVWARVWPPSHSDSLAPPVPAAPARLLRPS